MIHFLCLAWLQTIQWIELHCKCLGLPGNKKNCCLWCPEKVSMDRRTWLRWLCRSTIRVRSWIEESETSLPPSLRWWSTMDCNLFESGEAIEVWPEALLNQYVSPTWLVVLIQSDGGAASKVALISWTSNQSCNSMRPQQAILSDMFFLTILSFELMPWVLHVSKSWFGEIPCHVTATGILNPISARFWCLRVEKFASN